jgi:hypothetical protein
MTEVILHTSQSRSDKGLINRYLQSFYLPVSSNVNNNIIVTVCTCGGIIHVSLLKVILSGAVCAESEFI